MRLRHEVCQAGLRVQKALLVILWPHECNVCGSRVFRLCYPLHEQDVVNSEISVYFKAKPLLLEEGTPMYWDRQCGRYSYVRRISSSMKTLA